MEKMTPHEAWLDFWESAGQHIKPRTDDLKQAHQAGKEKARYPNGNLIVMTSARVEKLLERYAPGKYSRHDYFTKNGQPSE